MSWPQCPTSKAHNVAKLPSCCVPLVPPSTSSDRISTCKTPQKLIRTPLENHRVRATGQRWKGLILSFPTVPGWASEASCTSRYGRLKLKAGQEGHSILVASLHYYRLPNLFMKNMIVQRTPSFQVAVTRRARGLGRSSGHRWKALLLSFPRMPGYTSGSFCTPSYGRLKLKLGARKTQAHVSCGFQRKWLAPAEPFEVIYPQYNSIFVNIIIIIECENKEDGKNVTYISKRLNEKKSIAYTVENYWWKCGTCNTVNMLIT